MRLIDADDLKEWECEKCEYEDKDDTCQECCGVMQRIDEMPTIEAVPTDFHDKCQQIEIKRRMALEEELAKIIRCKDCVHWEEYHQKEYKGEGMCKESGYLDRRAEDFCSLAERKAESVEVEPSDTYSTGHNERDTEVTE